MASQYGVIEHNGAKFVILSEPSEAAIPAIIKDLSAMNVKKLVCAVVAQSYPSQPFEAAGISVHHLGYEDGSLPPDNVINGWLSVVEEARKQKEAVGVHCVAGLGRAPVLVAIALIEDGLNFMDAIELIRQKRRGAINMKQLKFLETYKPRRGGGKGCIVM